VTALRRRQANVQDLQIRQNVQCLKIGRGAWSRRGRQRCREQSSTFEVSGIVLVEGDDDVPDPIPQVAGSYRPVGA
jgi:hypothetical protein